MIIINRNSYQCSYQTILRKKHKLNTRLKCLKERNASSPKIPKLELKIEQLLNTY